MIIEKGKTLNGYAISVLFMKNNADLWLSGRYFFMEITKSNRTIIKQIMYSLSIAVTSFLGDDDSHVQNSKNIEFMQFYGCGKSVLSL